MTEDLLSRKIKYLKTLKVLENFGYIINNQIDLTHTNGYCKVIFAKKI